MAKKKIETAEHTTPRKRRKIPLLLVGLVLLGGLAAGGWFAYTTYFQSDYPNKSLTHVDLDKPVLRFTWEQLPAVYGLMVRANAELTLMTDEVARIEGVGKSYPRQDKIVSLEIKRWKKSVKKLTGQLRRFQSQAEALYVTFQVNPEKGRLVIDEKGPGLASAMQEVIAGVQLQTAPLKSARVLPRGLSGIIAKVKKRFF